MRLHIPHWRQRQQGECLAACAAMVLTYLGEGVDYERLKRQSWGVQVIEFTNYFAIFGCNRISRSPDLKTLRPKDAMLHEAR